MKKSDRTPFADLLLRNPGVLGGLSRFFSGFSRFWVGDFSRFVLFLSLGLFKHLYGTFPIGSATQSITTFPAKSGKAHGLEMPRLASLNVAYPLVFRRHGTINLLIFQRVKFSECTCRLNCDFVKCKFSGLNLVKAFP